MAAGNDNTMIMLCCVMQYTHGISYEYTHIYPALKSLGKKIKVFPLELARVGSTNMGVDDRFLDTIKKIKPKVLIIKPYRDTLRKETIAYATSVLGIYTVALFGDDEKFFDNGVCKSVDFALSFKLVTTTYKPAVKWYEKLGCKNVIHLGYGAYDKLFKPNPKVQKEYDISFCGASRDPRIDLLNYLAERLYYDNHKIKVFGSGWTESNDRVIDNKEYVEVINKTKINLNIGLDEVNGQRILQVKGRDFEVPMAGGFLLTSYNDYLKEFYKFGTEIETYKDKVECADKIVYYLLHGNKREKIALAGHNRAKKDHTYTKRMSDLLKKVK